MCLFLQYIWFFSFKAAREVLVLLCEWNLDIVQTVLFYYFLFIDLWCCPLQSRQKALADLHQMQNVHVSFYFYFITFYFQWATGFLMLQSFWFVEPSYILLLFNYIYCFDCWWVKKKETKSQDPLSFYMNVIILTTLFSLSPIKILKIVIIISCSFLDWETQWYTLHSWVSAKVHYRGLVTGMFGIYPNLKHQISSVFWLAHRFLFF